MCSESASGKTAQTVQTDLRYVLENEQSLRHMKPFLRWSQARFK
jgi:hypothetical protein